MRKTFKTAIAFVLAVPVLGPTPSVAWARPSQTALHAMLNGQATKLGTLSANASSVNNSTTAVTFSIAGGSVLKVQCDGTAFVNIGAAASATYTSADIGHPMTTGSVYYIVLADSPAVALVSMFSAAAVNCAVFRMY